MFNLIQQMVPKLAEHFTAWGVVLAGFVAAFATVGWDLPPFASMGRVETVETSVEKVVEAAEKRQQEDAAADAATMCILLDVQRTTWRNTLRTSELDLKKNPASESAKEAVDEARRRLRGIDRKVQALGRMCPI